MKLTSEKALELLEAERKNTNNNKWIEHSICVGNTASVIASALNLDTDYAKTLGYIHDIGKRLEYKSDGALKHGINGFNYIKSLGYDEDYARVCITHSYLNNDINCLADKTNPNGMEYQFQKEYVTNHEYTIYEKIINLCDLMCTNVVNTVDKRLIDLIIRKGITGNTQYHIKETYKLKEYFDNILGHNLYVLFPEIKDNL